MRNLTLLNRGVLAPASTEAPDLPVIRSVFDPLSNAVTALLGGLGVFEVQQHEKNGTMRVLASLETQEDDSVVLFRHFPDSSQLVIVFASGDIYSIFYEQDEYQLAGSVECGIHAAAWSPDEEILVLVTKELNTVLLSRDFEPLAERHLDPQDASKSNHVDVGWGKRETQFKGRGAKAVERKNAALRDPTMPEADEGALSAFDSGEISLTWRGDGEFFCVSAIEGDRRLLRVFDRSGALDSALEPVNGLEHHCAWKPLGSLIAAIQRHKDAENNKGSTARDVLINPELAEPEPGSFVDVVFFERNGLRHGQFALRVSQDTQVGSLSWNASLEVLAVLMGSSVQLWTSKNYHWYLKQEIFSSSGNDVTEVVWHPEKPLTLAIITPGGVEVLDLAWHVNNGPVCHPDVGMVAVIDGTSVGITPLAVANVPPPMAYRDVDVGENIVDVAISASNEGVAVVSNRSFALVQMKRRGMPMILAKIGPELINLQSWGYRQACFVGDHSLCLLFDDYKTGKSHFAVFLVEKLESPLLVGTFAAPAKVILLKADLDYKYAVFETITKKVYEIDDKALIAQERGVLGLLCYDFYATEKNIFGLDLAGKLYANSRQLGSAITSLRATSLHLLFTTAQHHLRFVHMENDFSTYTVEKEALQTSKKTQNHENEHESFADERIRSIERGSLLVTASPLRFLVVLQAPRGNLETIYPRIMVLSEVRRCVLLLKYKEAFNICRTHRIDLDILHDYALHLFFANLEHFVKEIEKEDHLCLFLSCLKDENVAETKYKETTVGASLSSEQDQKKEGKINTICKAILQVLRTKDTGLNLRAILTAYASQTPPNLVDALSLISNTKDRNEKERAVEYLCFLRDVNVLYDTALGMYDVPLTLLVAQQLQKDPKEYVPFLQGLHKQKELRRKFSIDDFLKRYEKALGWLYELEKSKEELDVEEEIEEYMVNHSLYKTALRLYDQGERRNKVLSLYSDALYNEAKYNESGAIYELLGDYEKAVNSYSKSKQWQNCLSAVSKANVSEAKTKEICQELVEKLAEDHRYKEAGFIEETYLKNVSEAVIMYCKDYRYDDAVLAITRSGNLELIEDQVKPLIGEGFGTIAELVSDCKNQITSQVRRLRELRQKKKEDPYGFFGLSEGPADDGGRDDVSVVASEASTNESFFTRYTGKTRGTALTGASRRTLKNRRREARKKARGKKGTIYEEEYLIGSVGRLHERLVQTQPELKRLLEGMIRFGRLEEARILQKSFKEVLSLLKENVDEVYSMTEDDRTRINEDGELYLVEIGKVPEVKEFEGFTVLDF